MFNACMSLIINQYVQMKCIAVILVFLLFLSSGCDLRKREDEVKKQLERINQKEQELVLREKTLQVKEEELLKREQKLDSSGRDSLMVIDSSMIGRWNVKMTCTETTCPGSAVGDVKSEEWELSLESNQIIARAFDGNKLLRIYSGIYTGNTIELVANMETLPQQPPTKMVARLRIVNNTSMEGQREINRENQCKIIYDLKLEKK